MKLAKVIPIFKNGDRHSMENYRPISLLPQFSKIITRLFVKQLDNFIEKYELLNEEQYGFRKNRTTMYAVMKMVEETAEASDKNEYSVDIFIDLRKAFDTVDHNHLFKKVRCMV